MGLGKEDAVVTVKMESKEGVAFPTYVSGVSATMKTDSC